MKKNFIAITLIALFFSMALTGCEKENNTTENINPALKNLKISDIKVQDGMLCFDSWEQYEQTIHALAEACENHVANYIDSIIVVLGTDDEEAINEQIAKDGFSQFEPLHNFANALHFRSLYNLLEQAEIQWMNDISSKPEDDPFNDIDIDRYETALYNEYGDINISGKVFSAKCFSRPSGCKQSDHITGNSEVFSYNGKNRYIHGRLATTTLSISASTTLYNKKNDGRKSLWFSKPYVYVEGKKGGCGDTVATNAFHPTGSSLPWGCYVFAISMKGTFPTYIVPGNNIHSIHSEMKTNKSIDIYL